MCTCSVHQFSKYLNKDMTNLSCTCFSCLFTLRCCIYYYDSNNLFLYFTLPLFIYFLYNFYGVNWAHLLKHQAEIMTCGLQQEPYMCGCHGIYCLLLSFLTTSGQFPVIKISFFNSLVQELLYLYGLIKDKGELTGHLQVWPSLESQVIMIPSLLFTDSIIYHLVWCWEPWTEQSDWRLQATLGDTWGWVIIHTHTPPHFHVAFWPLVSVSSASSLSHPRPTRPLDRNNLQCHVTSHTASPRHPVPLTHATFSRVFVHDYLFHHLCNDLYSAPWDTVDHCMLIETFGSGWVSMGQPCCGFPASTTDTVGNNNTQNSVCSLVLGIR